MAGGMQGETPSPSLTISSPHLTNAGGMQGDGKLSFYNQGGMGQIKHFVKIAEQEMVMHKRCVQS